MARLALGRHLPARRGKHIRVLRKADVPRSAWADRDRRWRLQHNLRHGQRVQGMQDPRDGRPGRGREAGSAGALRLREAGVRHRPWPRNGWHQGVLPLHVADRPGPRGRPDAIGAYGFWGCTSLESVGLPDSIGSIGTYAFQRCSSLSSIGLGKSLTVIGSYAFDGTAIATLEIPDTIVRLKEGALSECSEIRRSPSRKARRSSCT